MFTGIVQAVGEIAAADDSDAGRRLRIHCRALRPDAWRTGDSVAVAGCCLSALAPGADGFAADVSAETLARTTLGSLGPGDAVNLEPALAMGERLGGHLVSGHVDDTAEVVECRDAGDSRVLRLAASEALAGYVAVKGSVTLDGVSLTVNAVDGARFEVNLIPHTLANTTLGRVGGGDRLNLEVDLLARYLARLLAAGADRRGQNAT